MRPENERRRRGASCLEAAFEKDARFVFTTLTYGTHDNSMAQGVALRASIGKE